MKSRLMSEFGRVTVRNNARARYLRYDWFSVRATRKRGFRGAAQAWLNHYDGVYTRTVTTMECE